MSLNLTDEDRAGATRMYASATALKELILKDGQKAGLEESTILNVASDFQVFVRDLNNLTGMKFDVPLGFSEDRVFRAGSMVAAIEQVKRSIRIRTKEEVTSIVICTPIYRLRNTLLCQDFTISLEVSTETRKFVLGISDQGQAVMSERGYWETPREVPQQSQTPAPTQAPEPSPAPTPEPSQEPEEPSPPAPTPQP